MSHDLTAGEIKLVSAPTGLEGSDAGREATWRPRLPAQPAARPPQRDLLEAKPYPRQPPPSAVQSCRGGHAAPQILRDKARPAGPRDACGTQGTPVGPGGRLWDQGTLAEGRRDACGPGPA